MPTHAQLGEVLVRAGCLDAQGLARALEVVAKSRVSLNRALETLGLVDGGTIASVLAQQLGLDVVDLDVLEVPAEVASLLPAEFCRSHLVAPLNVEGKRLRIAMTNPLDYPTLQDVEFCTGMRVTAAVGAESSLAALLERTYPAPPAEKKPDIQTTYDLLSSVNPEGEVESSEADVEAIDISKLARDVNLTPIVRLVNMILCDAAKAGASDIHVEPQDERLLVRQRVDGMLKDVLKIPRGLQDSTVSRLKIISGMDIAERRKPQDGRSRLRFEGKRIDLRVSTLPTQFGEKVVIRLLDGSNARLDINRLGFSAENLRMFLALLSRPQGIILVTGPTGSGKTSTLYSALGYLKAPTKNIITVEDPIEFQLEGINQVQINPKAGMTFASGLRSILRQDPNIVLVGEIRDQETAGIAMEAAQTGHLLLSTLHTNDAISTITRLLDLGIEAFLVASSLTAVLSQRLTRIPCPSCSVEQAPPADVVEKIGGVGRLPQGAAFKVGLGCDACEQSGYKGRMAVHEVAVVTDEVRNLISRRAPEHEIRAEARRGGMRTLMEDAIDKASRGLTTLDEVVRVCPPDETPETRQATGPEPAARPSRADVPEEAPMPAPPGPPGARRVVVVDDSPTVATVIKYFMENEGFEVFLAADGREGLEAVKEHRPDVIISDVNMPGMDGIEMVRELRSHPDTAGTLILMLTSEDSVESEARGLEVGADDYILKPVEPRRLAARVKALLSRSTAREAVPR